MNPIHIALIGIRLVSIYLIAQGISSVPDIYLFVTTYDPESAYSAVIYGSVLSAIFTPLIIGVLLWFLAPKLTRYLISNNDTSNTNQTSNINQLQSSVIVLIGVFLLANNIPAAIAINYQLFAQTVEINDNDTLNLAILSNAIAINLKLLLALFLVMGSNLILRLIEKIRTLGTN